MAVFFKLLRILFKLLKVLLKELIVVALLTVMVLHIYYNIRESQRNYGATSISMLSGERLLLSDADKWYSIEDVDITYEPHLLLSVVSAVCGKRLGYDTGHYTFALALVIVPYVRGCAVTDFSTPRPTCHVIYLSTSPETLRHEMKHCLGYAHTGKINEKSSN